MYINIYYDLDKSFTRLHIENDISIKSLRKLISNYYFIDIKLIKLVYMNNIIEDDYNINYYDIINNATIFLIKKLEFFPNKYYL